MKKNKLVLVAIFSILFSITLIFSIQHIYNISKSNITLESPTGGYFSIPSTKGLFNLENQKGLITFIFFGFTKCPDICPLTLTNLNQMYLSLNQDEQKKIKILFISVDNERDNLVSLEEYLSKINSDFVGATTNDESINKILKLYGARYTKLKNEVTKEIYIDHTSQVFVINSRGEWADTLKYNSSKEEFLDAYKTADNKTLAVAAEKKSRIIPVLKENLNCDLSETDCRVMTFDNNIIAMSLSPKPIESEKDLQVKVSLTSDFYTPIEVDFEGLELNMGLIRPKLKLDAKHNFFLGEFYLPICEINEMTWIARLIVKDKNNQLGAFKFKFKTKL